MKLVGNNLETSIYKPDFTVERNRNKVICNKIMCFSIYNCSGPTLGDTVIEPEAHMCRMDMVAMP